MIEADCDVASGQDRLNGRARITESSGVSEGGFALHFDESGNFSAPAAFGTYRVLHQTGSGVLGPVFRAFDSPRDRLVAIKVFKLEILPEQVVRLADALRRLQSAPPVHPLIVPLLDVGLEGTTPYAVMSFQLGETLDIVLRRAAPMPIERALSILRPLAATLTAAAEAGVLHGALHPRDVFVPEDEDALAGVTGFGIVQALEAAGMGHPVLRRPYVAPERANGAWDGRADVFSLGVMAHELLTGRRPAPSGDQDGVFAREMAPERRVRLRKVLSTALAEQPDQRFRSAQDVINALEDVVHRSSAAPKAAIAAAATADPQPDPETTLGNDTGRLFGAEEAEKTADVCFPEEREEPEPESEPAPEPEPDPVTSVAAAEHPPADVMTPLPVVPLLAQPDPWVDTALTSQTYEVPAGVFGPPLVSEPRRSSVLVKTMFYAAAGLIVGVGGGLSVARTWFALPAPSPRGTGHVATSTPEQAAASGATVVEPDGPELPLADAQPAVAPGRLVVRSQPSGALVTLDGRRLGETPVVARGLAPGTYAVRVAHPGHVPRTERVTIRAAAPVRTLSVTLAPGVESTPTATTTRGAIDVDSRPRGARVIVDGRFVGLAPLRLADVGPGEHQVTLELGGYRSATGRVRVDAGRTSELTTTLRALQ